MIYSILGVQLIEDFLATGWTILGKQSEWPVVSFARGRTGFIRLPDRDIEEHDRLAKLDMALDVSPAALEQIGKVGYDPLFGARPLKRAIQQEIENPVAKLILAGRFGPKDVIPVDVSDGQFVFDRVVH